MRIVNEKNHEVATHREFLALPSGLGRLTLKLRGEADAKMVEAIAPRPGGAVVCKWTSTNQFTLDSGGESCLKFTLQSDPDLAQGERTASRELPAGHELTISWTDALIAVIEVKPSAAAVSASAPAVKPAATDNLSNADLQDALARAGIAYDPKKFNRAKAIVDLREKAKPVAVGAA